MSMHEFIPNLYESLSVDRKDDCQALGIQLAGRDAQLEQAGLELSDVRRKEVQLAFAILSSTTKRRLYDEALASGRKITWEEGEYLANFAAWPDGALRQPQPQVGWGKPVKEKQESPYHNTFNPYGLGDFGDKQVAVSNKQSPAVAHRPSQSTRMWMAITDLLIIGLLSGMVYEGSGSVVIAIVNSLVFLAFFLGMEVLLGGSPTKKICGYEVRDVTTGERLSLKQSAKRQWFRLVWAVPAIGPAISIAASLYYATTITPNNELRGTHDRLANAEVIKKVQ